MRGLHRGGSCPQMEGGRQHRTVERGIRTDFEPERRDRRRADALLYRDKCAKLSRWDACKIATAMENRREVDTSLKTCSSRN